MDKKTDMITKLNYMAENGVNWFWVNYDTAYEINNLISYIKNDMIEEDQIDAYHKYINSIYIKFQEMNSYDKRKDKNIT